MTTQQRILFVVIILLLMPSLMASGGVNINVINSATSASSVDTTYVLNRVTPYLDAISVPMRDKVTIEFDNPKFAVTGTDICAGHSYVNSGGSSLVDIHDIQQGVNRALLHEYVLARSQCNLLMSSTAFLEGLAVAKVDWAFRRMMQGGDATIHPQVTSDLSYQMQSQKWTTAGGTRDFFHNINGPGYDCIAGPMERLGALTNGDYRKLDVELGNLPANATRADVLGAFDRVFPLIDGVLPSVFLKESRCIWETPNVNFVDPRTTLGFSTDVGLTIQSFDVAPTGTTTNDGMNPVDFGIQSIVKDNNGSSHWVPTGNIRYTISDPTGKLIDSQDVDSAFGGARYSDKVINLPTGAYKRTLCARATDNTCETSPNLNETQFVLMYKESDMTNTGNRVMVITNGNRYGDFEDSSQFDLYGDSVGKFSVARYPGLFVVYGVPGGTNIQITDGSRVRTFTASVNADVRDVWKKFDDTFVMGVVDAITFQKTDSVFTSGQWLTLFTAGATHNNPMVDYSLPTQGCVGENGVTRVVFTLESGEKVYSGMNYCSQGQVNVLAPALPVGSSVTVAVELNGVESNPVKLNIIDGTLTALTVPRSEGTTTRVSARQLGPAGGKTGRP